MGNSGAWVYFLAKYLENTFRDETMAENGDKNEFITKEIWFFKVDDEIINFAKMVAVHDFHSWKRASYRNLADPNCQKYITTLSHNSEDIKNIEIGLIMKKLQAFEYRRNYIIFTQLL